MSKKQNRRLYVHQGVLSVDNPLMEVEAETNGDVTLIMCIHNY